MPRASRAFPGHPVFGPMCGLVCWLVCVALAGPLSGEEMPVGELVENVGPSADPSQTYTLYLPPGYGERREPGPEGAPAPERRYPALLILDPRGRGTEAARIFQPAAERFGWILLSSNHTASDGPMEPNVRAINALTPELARRWAADPARIYAAGMSGTAVVAWTIAARTGGLAGVIAAAAPHQPQVFQGVESLALAHFGTVGTEDFNFHQMRAMDELLGSLGATRRLELFDGGHGWMPRELASLALGWMEVQAIRQGRRAMDAALVRERLAADLERARSWESKGDPLAALWSYEALLGGYEGLEPVTDELSPVREKVQALSENAELSRARVELEQGAERERELRRKLGRLETGLRGERPRSGDELIARFGVQELEEQAAGAGQAAAAARRMLSTLVTYTGFYLHRDLRQKKDWSGAAAVLEVAVRIRPDDSRQWYNLACVRALAGLREAALEALEIAVETGFSDLELLEEDPDLESIRGLDGYRVVVAEMGRTSRGAVEERSRPTPERTPNDR